MDVPRDYWRIRKAIKNEVLTKDATTLKYGALVLLKSSGLSIGLRDCVFALRPAALLSKIGISTNSAFVKSFSAFEADNIVDDNASFDGPLCDARDAECLRCLLSCETLELLETANSLNCCDALLGAESKTKFPALKKRLSGSKMQTWYTLSFDDEDRVIQRGSGPCSPSDLRRHATNWPVNHDELSGYQMCTFPTTKDSPVRENVMMAVKFVRKGVQNHCEHIHKLSFDVPSWGTAANELCSFEFGFLHSVSRTGREHDSFRGDSTWSSFAFPEASYHFPDQRESRMAKRRDIWASAVGLDGPERTTQGTKPTKIFRNAYLRADELPSESRIQTAISEVCHSSHFFPLAKYVRAVFRRYTYDYAGNVVRMCTGGHDCGRVVSCLVGYTAPLCFVYSGAHDAHNVLQKLHAHFFSRLQVPNKDGQGPLLSSSLSNSFEDIIQNIEPEVVFHLTSQGMTMLGIAMPWMLGAFVTHLDVEEVLLLWDEIIGFGSTQPLAVAAAAIMSFRRASLLKTESYSEVTEALADLSSFPAVSVTEDFLASCVKMNRPILRGSYLRNIHLGFDRP